MVAVVSLGLVETCSNWQPAASKQFMRARVQRTANRETESRPNRPSRRLMGEANLGSCVVA